MSILHLVRSSAFNSNNLASAIKTALPNDAFILLDDGCYCLHHHLLTEDILTQYSFSAINTQLSARAISPHSQVTVISDLVELSFAHEKVITWQ